MRPKSIPYKPGYDAGSWKAVCDRCGSTKRNYQLKAMPGPTGEPLGILACEACWHEWNPQDRIQAVFDDPSVPWSRPNTGAPTTNDVAPFDPRTQNVI